MTPEVRKIAGQAFRYQIAAALTAAFLDRNRTTGLTVAKLAEGLGWSEIDTLATLECKHNHDDLRRISDMCWALQVRPEVRLHDARTEVIALGDEIIPLE